MKEHTIAALPIVLAAILVAKTAACQKVGPAVRAEPADIGVVASGTADGERQKASTCCTSNRSASADETEALRRLEAEDAKLVRSTGVVHIRWMDQAVAGGKLHIVGCFVKGPLSVTVIAGDEGRRYDVKIASGEARALTEQELLREYPEFRDAVTSFWAESQWDGRVTSKPSTNSACSHP